LEFDASSGTIIDRGPYQDHLKDWFETHVEVGADGHGAFVADLYASYTTFMKARGETPYAEETFAGALKARANELKIERAARKLRIGEKTGKGFKGIRRVNPPGGA
jgi:hypothetical protein